MSATKRPGLLKIIAITVGGAAIAVGLGFINLWLGIIATLVLLPLAADLMSGH